MRLRMEGFIKALQQEIVVALETLDPSKKFRIDTWTRPNGGGGISCVLQGGKVFEKAGVNTSIVYGTLPRPAIAKMRVNHKALDPDVESIEFFAAGISCVLHPQNPNAPTVHFNYRYFETMDAQGNCNAWWFGVGQISHRPICLTKTQYISTVQSKRRAISTTETTTHASRNGAINTSTSPPWRVPRYRRHFLR